MCACTAYVKCTYIHTYNVCIFATTTTPPQDSDYISYCKLDINIHTNSPDVLVHKKLPNPDQWRGTRVAVNILGNWTQYKSRVVQCV
jgi:DNA topoisomerase VI subunit B